jgi:hypothetical protein
VPDGHELEPIPEDVVGIGEAHSWLPPRADTQASAPAAGPDVVADAVAGAVVSLHRERGNRAGGVWLPAAARVINRLPGPNREVAWRVTLDFLHETLPDGTEVPWISATGIDLPEPVRQDISRLFPKAATEGFPAPPPSPQTPSVQVEPAQVPPVTVAMAQVPDTRQLTRQLLDSQLTAAVATGDLDQAVNLRRHMLHIEPVLVDHEFDLSQLALDANLTEQVSRLVSDTADPQQDTREEVAEIGRELASLILRSIVAERTLARTRLVIRASAGDAAVLRLSPSLAQEIANTLGKRVTLYIAPVARPIDICPDEG